MATIKINRAPVLTLWATIVAQHLGHDEAAALSLGRAPAGRHAQAKGQRLGLYRPSEGRKARREPRLRGQGIRVTLLGREIPALQTRHGIRATAGDQPIDPERVRRYLESKFSEHLADFRQAMEDLASSLAPRSLPRPPTRCTSSSAPRRTRLGRGR